MVSTDVASSAPPHIQPPMAQVPRPMRETGVSIPSMRMLSTLMEILLQIGKTLAGNALGGTERLL
ncbi:hypothetical protein P4200_18135 [Pseudomonas aeruginosa]|nr:hypothetical protein [Pseudomonas aeruginosa]